MLKAINIFDDLLTSREELAQAIFKRPDSLGELLPYEEYIASHGMFLNQDGSLGAVYEIDLIEHEPMSIEEISKKIAGTKPWFKLPGNCVLQVIHTQSAINTKDAIWDALKNQFPHSNQVSRKVLEEKIRFLKEKCKSDNKFRPLRRKTLLAIKYFPENKGSVLGFAKNYEDYKALHTESKKTIASIRAFNGILKELEEGSKVGLSRWTDVELVSDLRLFFNPKTALERNFASISKVTPLRNQLVFCQPELSYEGISREKVKTRTISLKNCPQFSIPGGMADFLKVQFPFRLVMNFSFPTHNSVDSKLKLKTMFLENTPSFKGKKQLEELRRTQEQLAEGDRCLHMSMAVIIEGETEEELDSRQRKILNIFTNELDCEAIVENDIGLGVCLNSLPLMYSPETDISTQRYFRVLQSDAQNFLPIFDSYKGTEEFQQVFLSRENNIVPFSFKSKKRSSHHCCVVAHTGSGKSTLVSDIVQAYKQKVPDPLIFYIEKRASSKYLSKYFDGEISLFTDMKSMDFSPFRGKFDDEKVKFLSLLIMSGVKQLNESFQTESEHSSVLTAALKEAYLKKKDEASLSYEAGEFKGVELEVETTISMEDVVNAIGGLKDNPDFIGMNSHVDEMVKRLRDFHGTGKYSDLFHSVPNTSGTENRSFFVYDFDGLENDPVLQNLVTLSVFEEIRRIVSLPENSGREGIIVFEEIGQLGKNNPTAAKFVEDYAETIRKLGISLIACAPKVEHYFEVAAGRAMWGAADNFFFLVTSDDAVDYILKNSKVLTPEMAQIVKDLKMEPGIFAECFYTDKEKTNMGAFRLLRAPTDRWVCPSNEEDRKVADEVSKVHEGTGYEFFEKLLSSDSEALV